MEADFSPFLESMRLLASRGKQEGGHFQDGDLQFLDFEGCPPLQLAFGAPDDRYSVPRGRCVGVKLTTRPEVGI